MTLRFTKQCRGLLQCSPSLFVFAAAAYEESTGHHKCRQLFVSAKDTGVCSGSQSSSILQRGCRMQALTAHVHAETLVEVRLRVQGHPQRARMACQPEAKHLGTLELLLEACGQVLQSKE